MRYTKGQSGNPNGRPVGSANRSSSKLRDWITAFLEDNKDQIAEDWKALEPRDRIVLFEKLLKYSLPTLQSTTLQTDFEKLTDDQLDKIIADLRRA